MARNWVQVERKNNWENEEYFYQTEVGTRVYLSECNGRRISSVVVRWPDGLLYPADIIARPVHRTCSDMGHSYSVRTELLEVVLDVRGIMMSADLSKFEIDPDTITWVDV